MDIQQPKGQDGPTPMPRTGSEHSEQDDSASSTALSRPPGRYQPDSKFMGLPLELTTKVFDCLRTAHDSIAFSLACRGLFDHFFVEARAQFNSAMVWDKFDTRVMVENTAPPGRVSCVFCLRVHTVDEEYRRAVCLERIKAISSSFDIQLVGGRTRKLKFLNARFILDAVNSNRPGADKFLESLGWKSEARTGRAQWVHQAEAKVHWGRLFLDTISRHVHPDQPFEEFTYSICKHVHIYAEYPSIFADFGKLSSTRDPGNGFHIQSTCDPCGASWAIGMEWIMQPEKVAREGWALKICSNHLLGNLAWPEYNLWASSAGGYETPNAKEMIKRREGHWRRIFQDFSWKSGGEHEAGT